MMAEKSSTKQRTQLRQTGNSMVYEYGRMAEELSAIGVNKTLIDTVSKNAEVRPGLTMTFVLKHFAQDLDSRSLAAVKRCIVNLGKLSKKAGALRRALKIPATATLAN